MSQHISGKKALHIVMMLGGVVLSALGMALYYFSALGSDPVSVFIDGLHSCFHLSYGMVLNGFNIAVLTTVILFARKEIGIGMVISLLFSGVLLDGWMALLNTIPVQNGILARVFIFALGILSLSLGTALFLESKLGAAPWDTVLVTISKKTRISFCYIRFFSDASFTIIGYFLGGIVGIGTLLSVLTVGMLIDCFCHILAQLQEYGTHLA